MTEPPKESELIKCTVISCPNYFHRDLLEPQDHRFFPFPANPEISKTWTEKCGVAADHTTKTAKVCSDHFKPTDYEDVSMTTLKPDSVPKENLGWMIGMPEVELPKSPKFEQIKEAVDMNERLKERFEKLIHEQNTLKLKIDLYKKKINNVEGEIFRLRGLIDKYPVKRRNGKLGLISKVFSQAQIKMLLGKKKVVWSYDDMAMAFTLRHLGNKECYLYLKDTLNLPLPNLAAVQRWVASNKAKP